MYTMKGTFLYINILLPVKTNLHCIFWHTSSAYHLKITYIWFSVQQNIWRTVKPLFRRWFCLQQLNFHHFHIFSLSKNLTRTLETGFRAVKKKRGHSPWEHKCLNGDMLHTFCQAIIRGYRIWCQVLIFVTLLRFVKKLKRDKLSRVGKAHWSIP